MNTSKGSGGLISLSGNLEDPRNAKASDFPAVGPMGPAGMAEGAGKLVTLTEMQEGPRHVNDSGENTPSTWGSEDKGFTVMKNKGEGVGSSSISYKGSIDCETGQMVPNAAQQTY
jgi:hypothetical protein